MKVSKELKKELRLLAKVFGYKLVDFYGSEDDNSGSCVPSIKQIRMNLTKIWSTDVYLSIFCHELMHVLCIDAKIYNDYHTFFTKKNPNIVRVRKTAFTAEVYVDNRGKELFEFMFPNREFYVSVYIMDPEFAKENIQEMINNFLD